MPVKKELRPESMLGPEKFLAVSITRTDTEEKRRELGSLGLLDPSRKIKEMGDLVEIPVKGMPTALAKDFEIVVQDQPEFRPEAQDPFDRIHANAEIDDELKAFLPRKWELVGDIVLLKLPDELKDHSKQVAKAYADELKARAVLNDLGIEGEFREPKLEVLLGDGGATETVHTENKVRFALDPMKIMFSSGNIDERIRMATMPNDDEVVVDMFAGIGYFSIPMAVHSRPSKIIACEKNPVAFEYLKRNIELNKVQDSVEPILGDNLDAPERVADRIIMGYLPSPQEYLTKAISILKRFSTGTIHYHENATENEIPWALYSRVAGAAGVIGRGAQLVGHRWIKSYAPKVWHAVVDVEIFG
jgi:tRNA wybutosine-synthesizing protein 2